MSRVLIVDDEKGVRVTLQAFLQADGYEVETSDDVPTALRTLQGAGFDVVVSDIILPRMTGVELLHAIRQATPRVQVILMTGEPTVETASEAVRAGAFDYLFKPVGKAAILRTVANAVHIKALDDERERLAEANRQYQTQLEKLVAERTAALQDTNRRLEDALRDLKSAHQRIIQQERLNALGQMASGIAHDFNNVLMPILGLSDFLLANPEAQGNRRDLTLALENIRSAASDAREIARRLRQFYKPDETLERTPVDLRRLVEQCLTLTEPAWKVQPQAENRPVRMEARVEEGLTVPANESALREVLTNLILNAVDAMPAGGTVHLAAQRQGDEVAIRVTDTGVGMTPEVLRRCREPFFTTKGEHGTGLGLSVCHGIAESHGGALDIQSEVGKGTTVTVRLPLAGEKPGAGAFPAPEPEAPAPGRLRILVVDDEAPSRALLACYLAAGGHETVVAASGGEAMEILAGRPVELLITDRAMPGMSGDVLAETVRERWPGTAILMLTGFSDLMKCQRQKPDGVDELAGKPITQVELLAAVARAVASRRKG